MATFTITLKGIAATQTALKKLKAALADRRPMLNDIGHALTKSVQDRFVAMQSPDGAPWKPLHPRTIRQKRNKQKILTERGLLRGSIHYEEDDEVTIYF